MACMVATSPPGRSTSHSGARRTTTITNRSSIRCTGTDWSSSDWSPIPARTARVIPNAFTNDRPPFAVGGAVLRLGEPGRQHFRFLLDLQNVVTHKVDYNNPTTYEVTTYEELNEVVEDPLATQRELKRRGRALAERRKLLEHGAVGLGPQQREEAAAALAEELDRLRELQEGYRSDLAAARERQTREMIARIEEVAREVARDQGIAVLVRRADILQVAEGADLAPLDVTDAVIRALLEKINPTEIPPAGEPEPAAAESG